MLNHGQSTAQDTHKESDLPALHLAHLEDDDPGLVVGQGDAAVDLVTADREHGTAAWLRVVTAAGIQLHAPIVLHLPA